jgi:hypothetical protein
MEALELELSEVQAADRTFTRIVVGGEGLGSHLAFGAGCGLSHHRLDTGDVRFDGEIEPKVAPGWEVVAFAQLSGATRGRISALVRERRLTLQEGRLCVELNGPIAALGAELTALVEQCLELGRSLVLDQANVAFALAANARSDLHAEVRLKNLEALGAAFRGTPMTRGAGAVALSDADARVRSAGAALTGGR